MAERGLRYVALDFGAESGRTIVGRFDGDQLSVEPVHRYANTPVRMGGTFYWDFPRQFGDILAGMGRAAADGAGRTRSRSTPGAWTTPTSTRGAASSATPSTIATRATKACSRKPSRSSRATSCYMATGIQFMSINTLYQLLSEVRADDPILEQADKLLMMPDIFNHFLSGVSVASTPRPRPARRSTRGPRDWATAAVRPTGYPYPLPARDRAARHGAGPAAQRGRRRDRAAGAPRSWPGPRTTRRRPWPPSRWPGRRPPTSRRAPGRWSVSRCRSRS